jgi:tetratricopeptide (TPR) repeat protein
MTNKTNRNDPCPCGSGKKYKKCHLEKDQESERAELTRVAAKRAAAEQAQIKATRETFEASQALDAASNAVNDLVRAGRLDEAERAAQELLERYPEVPDGHERLGRVYEARGDHRRAADCYRKVIEFIRAHPGDFDPQYEQFLLSKINPPATG